MKTASAMHTNPRRISHADLLKLFTANVHPAIQEQLARDDVTGMAVFENMQLDSSQLGHRAALAYGPDCTYTRLADLKDGHLGSVPSQFTWCTYYYRKHMRPPIRYVEIRTHSVLFVRHGDQKTEPRTRVRPRHFYTTKSFEWQTENPPFNWETDTFGRLGKSGIGNCGSVHYSFPVV